MCGCGQDSWCEGDCPCGCDHGSWAGQARQAQHFALQYQSMQERSANAFERGREHMREHMVRECFTHQDDLIKDIRKGVKRLPVRFYYIPDGGYWAEPKYWVTVDSVTALLDKMEGTS